jgi:histidyl-tRNA synthetase
MKLTAIKGFSDILPGDVETWQVVEEKARQIFWLYNFSEIRIPILEKTELFSRSLGETTDIVEKEMYTFADQDAQGSLLTLRPEGTAGVVRAYVEAEMYKTEPVRKLYYLGPMFRRERPQKGRMRQFHQIGAEALGRGDPLIDAEILLLLREFFSNLDLEGITLQLNSLGDAQCRPRYREKLLAFLKQKADSLCANCRRRMERNPLRVLDCKEPGCIEATKEAPSILESLCAECGEHFDAVQRLLAETKVAYVLNPRLVRGLDYYCRTTFEWTSNQLGAQNAVGAGGRYDGLVDMLDGPKTPAVGFALGLERVSLMLPESAVPPLSPLVFVAAFGTQGLPLGVRLLDRLRSLGVRAETDYRAGNLKTLLRQADRAGAAIAIILGDDESAKGRVVIRDMATKVQEELPLEEAAPRLRERLGIT